MKTIEKIWQKARKILVPLAFISAMPLFSSCNEYVKKIEVSAYRHGAVVLQDGLSKTVQSQDAIAPKEAFIGVVNGLQRQVDSEEYDSVQVVITVAGQSSGKETVLKKTLLPKR